MQSFLFADDGAMVPQQPVEYVERKGLGHPDSICDSIMEAAAESLRQEYRQRCGHILHHNLDKALLVAGQSEPAPGGGRVVSPIQIIAGDRAMTSFGDVQIPVAEIVESSVSNWIDNHLRFVDSGQHIDFRSEIKPGSTELREIFDRSTPVANDTSAAVGFAPLSETERIVLDTERYINSVEFKERFPVAGEDVKVMAARHFGQLHLTIAIAMVDRFVASESDYFEQKERIRDDLHSFVSNRLERIQLATIDVNTLDDPQRGQAGMYLTVLGTSAESGDGGEVGRGNAVNGLISLNRPTSNEAAAGKNTTCHVGHIYNHLTYRIAEQIVTQIDPVLESYVWLCSQIGRPVDDPWSASVRVTLADGVDMSDVQDQIDTILQHQLKQLRSTPADASS
jgi:S-adenosylmethionine synthetase